MSSKILHTKIKMETHDLFTVHNPKEIKALISHLTKHCFESSMTPSLFKNKLSHSFYFSLRKKLAKLSNTLQSTEVKTLIGSRGNLVSMDSFGSCWVLQNRGALFQLGTRKNRVNFLLPYKVEKNVKPFFKNRDLMVVFTEKFEVEIWENRKKRRLFRMKISEEMPRIKPTEVHVDTDRMKLRLNYGNFYQILDVCLLTKTCDKIDLTGIRTGGQVYCRATFLPFEDKGLIFVENDLNDTQKSLFNFNDFTKVKKMNYKTKNMSDYEQEGGNLGTLLWIDKKEKKFVQFLEEKANLFQFSYKEEERRGNIQLINTYSDLAKDDLNALKYIIGSFN